MELYWVAVRRHNGWTVYAFEKWSQVSSVTSEYTKAGFTTVVTKSRQALAELGIELA